MLAWSVNGYLAGVAGVDEPGEGAALVHVLLQRESRLLFGQVAEVSCGRPCYSEAHICHSEA